MSVKFDFVLNDFEAEALISCLHDKLVSALEALHSHKWDKPTKEWYVKHAAFLQGIKDKILAGNTRVL